MEVSSSGVGGLGFAFFNHRFTQIYTDLHRFTQIGTGVLGLGFGGGNRESSRMDANLFGLGLGFGGDGTTKKAKVTKRGLGFWNLHRAERLRRGGFFW